MKDSRKARARGRVGGGLIVVLLVATILAVFAGNALAVPAFNKLGNILISDQFNNRVIELSAGKIVWHFGTGSFVAGSKTIVAPNDAQRVGTGTLIAGTGAPAGTPGYPAAGAQDNRVILVSKNGIIVWQYGKAGVAGSGFNRLNAPVQATWLPNRHILITDQGNARVIEVTMNHRIVWQYGVTGVPGKGFDRLNNPNSAELLANGDVLIADESNNRVIEVNRAKQIVWSYSRNLSGPAFASRLPNGHTLITDSLHNRVIEVTHAKVLVWVYKTNKRHGSVANPTPTRAVRTRNGLTLISDQFNDQVIIVDRAKQIVFRYGTVGVPGKTAGFLNAPYDAKRIGDFTGLTPLLRF